jgi:hypothetical protein
MPCVRPVCLCVPARTNRQEAFRRVDLTLVSEVARLSREAGVQYFSHVTAQGANAASWLLYMKTKGEAEAAIVVRTRPVRWVGGWVGVQLRWRPCDRRRSWLEW